MPFLDTYFGTPNFSREWTEFGQDELNKAKSMGFDPRIFQEHLGKYYSSPQTVKNIRNAINPSMTNNPMSATQIDVSPSNIPTVNANMSGSMAQSMVPNLNMSSVMPQSDMKGKSDKLSNSFLMKLYGSL